MMVSGCSLDENVWHRIDKDLYLGKAWATTAHVWIQRKKEEDLILEDKVIVDVRVGRRTPESTEKGQGDTIWESRPGGIWLKRSTKHQDSDLKKAVTSVDVLFGVDAVEPRPGWEIKDPPLLLETPSESQGARLSVRKGPSAKIDKPTLRVTKDGKFKIMQVSDLHLSTGTGICRDAEPKGFNGGKCEADTRTLEFIGRLLDEEKPQLVVLSGDQVNGETSPDVQSAIFKFAELFIQRKIPYAAIFGNHDDEGNMKRSALMSVIEPLPFSLSSAGPSDIAGVGNYFIEVLGRGASHNSALTIYMMDTHGYSPDERTFKGYDWLKQDQIDWFRKTAQANKAKDDHVNYPLKHMDMAFIHIPLPEYRDPSNPRVGAWRESPTAPGFNSGFRDALVEMGVSFVSCGHDHVNDYCALSRDPAEKPALWMCYAGGSGFGGYGGYGGYHRRVRFFNVDANSQSIKTYKRVEWGETEKRLDEQIIVEGGHVVEAPSGGEA
ncbi:MAG: hypothetical protein M1814_006417 [Vezdaea aestivalis]|nr:MAG: hypothetical protein M1814_006417 [Vezdaea aestivalis]